MSAKPKLREAVVVEGRYDKNTLSQAVDAVILETGGFQIFSEPERLRMLRNIANARGLVILTDPDGAGFLIRSYLKGSLPMDRVKHAYIPDVFGREKRKSSPSGEGKLGVEGMPTLTLIEALRRAEATFEEDEAAKTVQDRIERSDLYEAGLSGTNGAAERRRVLLRELCLPERLSAGALTDVLSALMSREEFFLLTKRLFFRDHAEERGQEE
jgi:ribonuclease M5